MLPEPIVRDGLRRLGYPASEVDRRLSERYLDPDCKRSLRLMAAAVFASQLNDEPTADALRTVDNSPRFGD